MSAPKTSRAIPGGDQADGHGAPGRADSTAVSSRHAPPHTPGGGNPRAVAGLHPEALAWAGLAALIVAAVLLIGLAEWTTWHAAQACVQTGGQLATTYAAPLRAVPNGATYR